MSYNQTQARFLNRGAARYKRCVEAYQTSMRSVIRSHAASDPKRVEAEHYKIAKFVSDGFVKEDKKDFEYLLDEHFLNMLEQEEEAKWQISSENLNENRLCIYLTREWVYVVGCVKKLGCININFGSSKPGFAALIKHSDGNLAWSEDYDNLTKDKHGKSLKVDILWSVISNASGGNETSMKLIEELFERLKQSSEGGLNEVVSQVTLVMSRYFNNWEYRKILRDGCRKTGFKRIVIVSEDLFVVSKILSNCQFEGPNVQTSSVLVVAIYNSYILMLIFGNEPNGVQLLGTSYCGYPVLKERVKTAYKRALAQLSTETGNSIRYYVVLNDYYRSDKEKIVDEVFQDGRKLIKYENFRGDRLKEIFLDFCSSSTKQTKFLEASSSKPTEATADMKNYNSRTQLSGNCVAYDSKLGSECPQCRGLHSILNYYKIGQNSLPC